MSYQFFKSNDYEFQFPMKFNLDEQIITEFNLPEWNGTNWLPITLLFSDSIDTETQVKIYNLIENENGVGVFYIHLKNKGQLYKTWEIGVDGINKASFGSCYHNYDGINTCWIEFNVVNCKIV